jgi:hypothetical protein
MCNGAVGFFRAGSFPITFFNSMNSSIKSVAWQVKFNQWLLLCIIDDNWQVVWFS